MITRSVYSRENHWRRYAAKPPAKLFSYPRLQLAAEEQVRGRQEYAGSAAQEQLEAAKFSSSKQETFAPILMHRSLRGNEVLKLETYGEAR